MKIKDIIAGRKALVRIEGKLVKVLIGMPHPRGGWKVTRLEDGEKLQLAAEAFVALMGEKPKPATKKEKEEMVAPRVAPKPLRTRPAPKPLRMSQEERDRNRKEIKESLSHHRGDNGKPIMDDAYYGIEVQKPSDEQMGQVLGHLYENPNVLPTVLVGTGYGKFNIEGTMTGTTRGVPHLIVEARAGTGKTTTLVEGIKRIFNRKTPGLIGSEQQEAVWKAMRQGPKPQTVGMVAFNKSIATELQKRVPDNCEAMTMHSLGLEACRRAYKIGKYQITEHKTMKLLEKLLGKDWREIKKDHKVMSAAVQRLVSLCKLTLTDPTEENILVLAADYEVGIESDKEKNVIEDICNYVPRILHESRTDVKSVDFDDMIWLPVVNGLQTKKFDLLLVDEAQDLNRCQQELAKKVGTRLVLCGDPKQAIYGFAGADTMSMSRMRDSLGERGGCQVLPLTVTRRCGKAIVELAQSKVPDFEAFPTNPEGEIEREIEQSDAWGRMQYGDMVLCRVNAPLVSLVFKLVRMEKKANIQGRNIGEQIWNFIEQLRASDLTDLIVRLDSYRDRELEKIRASKWGSEAQEIALIDKCACVSALAANVESIYDIKQKIDTIFSDQAGEGIRLLSIHRAKGLEANVVWIIEPGKLPHPMAKSPSQREQEDNLWYVAVTRAIRTLRFVKDSKKENDES